MSPEEIGFAAIAGLVGLVALGCPVALAMILAGGTGFAAILGTGPALTALERSIVAVAGNHGFTIIPLFLLMGALAARAGLSRDLFEAARRLTGRWPGGIALAGVTASAGFAAVSGSSLATASTMTRVAWPEMRRLGYDPRLAAGSLAAGGTLGIMIPPSVALMLYALVTGESVGEMFLAGVLPGLLGYLLYLGAIAVMARIWQGRGTPDCEAGDGRSMAGRVLPVAALFVLVMGGLYGGVFTPTEAGGAGAALALGLALMRGMRWAGLRAALAETVGLSGGLFLILIGAEVFGYLLSVSRLGPALVAMVEAAGWGPWGLLLAILGFYLLLGCVMESLAMILLTVPIFHPLIVAAGLDPVWFGILAVVAVEAGLISPPVGMNLYVVRSGATGLTTRQLMVGVMPFLAADIVRLAVLLGVPALALWLPGRLAG